MRKYCQSAAVVVCLAGLASCQMPTSINSDKHEGFFQSKPTNVSLTVAIQEAFLHTKLLAPLPLHVETANGVVYLSGYVKTIRQSDTAGDVARAVPGVKSVENNIIVRK